MSNRIINIHQNFKSSSLITRQAARDMFNIIVFSPEVEIILDFSDIAHASRSFFDEFNSHLSKIKLLSKKLEMVNLDPNLSNLLLMVQNSSKLKSSLPYSSVSNAKSINI